MGSQKVLAAAKLYRDLLRAVKKHVGNEEYTKHFSEYVTDEFRKNCQVSDPSLVTQKIKLANDYTFLLNSVHHQKVFAIFHFFGFSFTNLILSCFCICSLLFNFFVFCFTCTSKIVAQYVTEYVNWLLLIGFFYEDIVAISLFFLMFLIWSSNDLYPFVHLLMLHFCSFKCQKFSKEINVIFFWFLIHKWQDLLFSYNIAVDRSEEMKRTLGKSAASVGLQLPEVYKPWDHRMIIFFI